MTADVSTPSILFHSTTTPALVLADLAIPGLPLLEFLLRRKPRGSAHDRNRIRNSDGTYQRQIWSSIKNRRRARHACVNKRCLGGPHTRRRNGTRLGSRFFSRYNEMMPGHHARHLSAQIF